VIPPASLVSVSMYRFVCSHQPAGDISGQGGQGLEFKSWSRRVLAFSHRAKSPVLTAFLSTDPAPNRSTSPSGARDAPNVPYSPFNIAYYQVRTIPIVRVLIDNCFTCLELFRCRHKHGPQASEHGDDTARRLRCGHL